MPARPALGDDFARFELRENIVAHLASLDCPEPPPSRPWPGDAPNLSRPDAPPLSLGDVHALQVCSHLPHASLDRSHSRALQARSHTISPCISRVLASLTSLIPQTEQEHARSLAADLEALRVACTDPSSRLGGLLHGGGPCAEERLAWCAPLCEPAACLAMRDAERVANLLLVASRVSPEQHTGTPTANAFGLLRSLPFWDRGLAAACLPCDHAYELDVARFALPLLGPSASYHQCAHELSAWRRRGLLYPLLVASAHMPTPEHWLPPELHAETSARGLEALLAALADPRAPDFRDRACTALRAFIAAQDMAQPSARAIAALLDRLALAMRVRPSAARPADHCLDRCLPRLAAVAALPPHEAWGRLAQALEQALPASALCRGLMPHLAEPPAWAAPPPRYELADSSPRQLRLRFAPIRLEPHDGYKGKGPAIPDPRMRRLCALVQRLGRACLSQELASAMLRPLDALRSLERVPTPSPNGRAPAYAPASVMHAMHTHAPPELHRFAAKRALDAALALRPTPTRAPCPHAALHLLAWRVEGGKRVVLYTGASAVEPHDIPSMVPHTLQKALLPDRSRRPELAEISAWPAPPAEHDVRLAVLRAARACLRSGFIERVRGQRAGVQSTGLEEAVLQFVRAPPEACHASGGLRHTTPWRDDHIDPRYAETQTASNGTRYRDWLCLYAGPDGEVEKCRLEAHTIAFQRLYHVTVPLGDGRWVQVRSTLPFPHASLLESSGRSLAEHVRARYSSDPDTLPKRNPGDTVERHNVAFYSHAQHTLVAYAPTGASDALEFVSFALA